MKQCWCRREVHWNRPRAHTFHFNHTFESVPAVLLEWLKWYKMTGVQCLMGPLSGRNSMSGKRPQNWMVEKGGKNTFSYWLNTKEQDHPYIDAWEVIDPSGHFPGFQSRGEREDIPDRQRPLISRACEGPGRMDVFMLECVHSPDLWLQR